MTIYLGIFPNLRLKSFPLDIQMVKPSHHLIQGYKLRLLILPFRFSSKLSCFEYFYLLWVYRAIRSLSPSLISGFTLEGPLQNSSIKISREHNRKIMFILIYYQSLTLNHSPSLISAHLLLALTFRFKLLSNCTDPNRDHVKPFLPKLSLPILISLCSLQS